MAPAEAAKGVTCPSSPPTSPPSPGDDPYPGATITTYDARGPGGPGDQPSGGHHLHAYDQAGDLFCTVAPAEAADDVTCPPSPPPSPPTVGYDPYLGATITTYDANGRVVQVTNPLGGLTLTSYDAANNVAETTVESDNARADPNVVTPTPTTPTTRSPPPRSTPAEAPSPPPRPRPTTPTVTCTARSQPMPWPGDYQCPPWQAAWATSPPNPSSLYSSTPSPAQANNVTTSSMTPTATSCRAPTRTSDTSISAVDGDGRTYCSAGPTNVSAWLEANPSGTYPYLCPATPAHRRPPRARTPGYVTTSSTPPASRCRRTDQVGDTTTYTYAPDGQVLTTTDPRGQVTTNCYYYQDATGECAHGAPGRRRGRRRPVLDHHAGDHAPTPPERRPLYTYYPGDAAEVRPPPLPVPPPTPTTPTGTSPR